MVFVLRAMQQSRSLGTFMILDHITRRAGSRYVYLATGQGSRRWTTRALPAAAAAGAVGLCG
jgi:hypothetical protein